MKRLHIICLLLLVVLTTGFSYGCNKFAKESVDRTVIGQVVAIDRVGNYSTLHFNSGVNVVVSNASLSHWKTAPLLTGVWVYNLHTVKTQTETYYNIVSITANFPLGGPTTTISPP